MQALELNLASRPFRNNTLLWLGYGLATLFVLAFTAWNVRSYVEHSRLLAELEAAVGSMDGQRADLAQRDRRFETGLKGYDLKSLYRRTDKANEVIRWKAFSWTGLFNLLEQILPNGVRMVSVHPLFHGERKRGERLDDDADRGVPVAVEGVARDLVAFLDLERSLLADPHFERVDPDKTEIDDRTGEMIFRLRFVYVPDEGAAPTADEPPVDEATDEIEDEGELEPMAEPAQDTPARAAARAAVGGA